MAEKSNKASHLALCCKTGLAYCLLDMNNGHLNAVGASGKNAHAVLDNVYLFLANAGLYKITIQFVR